MIGRIAMRALLVLTAGSCFAAETLVLDESAYCRSHIELGIDRIDPTLLKAEGAKLLGKRGLPGLKRSVKRRWAHLGKPWDEKAWMDDAMVNFVGLQYGDRSAVDTLIHVPPAPGDWAGPGFDDSQWLRQRLPLMVGKTGPGGRESSLGRRRGCLRFRFEVPDPAKARDLTLALTFRGGARVLLNGTEIARSHLPADEAFAEPYPIASYCHLDAEGAPKINTDRRGRKSIAFVGDFYGPFDKAAPRLDRKRRPVPGLRQTTSYRKHFVLNREQWDRMQGLRNRTVGPVTLPAKLLRKGGNVLAVEIRAARLHPIAAAWTSFVLATNQAWDHCSLVRMRLSDPSGSVPSAMVRPAGVQVWAADMHRRFVSSEYGEPGAKPGTLRFAGAPNGTFSGQIVISTDSALEGLGAVAGRDLSSAGGAVIPAANISFHDMPPHPLSHMIRLGQGRGGGDIGRNVLIGPVNQALRRHAGAPASRDARNKRAGEVNFFDHIAAALPRRVDANTCRPMWVRLHVPANARPGTYRGTISVGAKGLPPVSVPVVAEVHDWRVPAGKFQTVVGMEQYPYSVAEYYKVPLWSDAHFRLMEPTFRQMARAGNDWLFLPVINFTEFGNQQRSMVGGTIRRDGTLAFDLRIVDRYLNLVVKHLGRPRVLCFVIMMGARGNPAEMQVRNEATGKMERLDLTPKSARYHSGWKTLATAIYDFMKSKGLDRSLHWGYAWDSEADPSLPALLAQITPGVPWASGTHGHAAGKHYTAKSFIYKIANYRVRTAMGWKRSDILLINPRPGGNIIGLNGHTNPLGFRLISPRAIVSGVSGPGRLGADDFANIFFRGVKSAGFLRPGMPVSAMFWPGTNGAESSARFEALIEGLQEAEARIFLEQAIDRSLLPRLLVAKAQRVLFEHNRGTFYISSLSDYPAYSERTPGWQARSARLFAVAAEAAKVVGLDVDKTALAVSAPARGKPMVELRLRNWTTKPRRWTARAGEPWIVPSKRAGTLDGVETLEITIDAAGIEAGAVAKGRLTVTDLASGRVLPVAVTATAGQVLEFVPPEGSLTRVHWGFRFIPHKGRVPFNVTTGAAETREVMVHNRSAADIRYKVAASVPWLKVEPGSGKAGPRSPITLKVTAAPPDRSSAYHQPELVVQEVGGPAGVRVPLAVHVIPPYRMPALPKGKAVPITGEVWKATIKRYNGVKGAVRTGALTIDERLRTKYWPKAKAFKRMLCGGAPYEAVFNLKGKGYTAFCAQVGFPDVWNMLVGMWALRGDPTDRLNFEIYIDGKLRTQSGLMKPTDPFRLLVVDGLGGASEMRLVVRPLTLPSYPLNVFWFDPAFYKGK